MPIVLTSIACLLAHYNPVWTNGDLGVSHDRALPTAALLGNGSLGAVNGGEGGVKRLVLTRGDIWSCGALENGRGKDPHREIMPISFAEFEIGAGAGATAYTDTLDIATATLETQGLLGGVNVSLQTYVVSCEDILVVSGVAGRDAVWNLKLRVHGAREEFPAESFATDACIGVRRRTIDATNGDPRGWSTNATAVLHVVGGEVLRTRVLNRREASAEVRLAAGRPFSFVVAPAVVPHVAEAAVSRWRGEHLSWWHDWWGRSRVSIGDDQLERYYYGSLYLLGSCCRPGKQPSGLYGIWVTTDEPRWHNDFHLNYNYIATYYGCYAANRPEIADTLPDPLVAYLPRAVENARYRLAELDRRIRNDGPDRIDYVKRRADLKDGIADAALYPVGLAPCGVSSEGDCKFWNQTLNGPFQAAAVCTCWEYTLDREYLKKAWPFLDKVANFYLAWCEKELLPDGRFQYALWDSMSEGNGLRKNCALTIGSVRYLLETLVSVAPTLRELGFAVSDAKVAAWQGLARNLAPLPTGISRVDGRDVRTFSSVESDNGHSVLMAGGGFELESVIPGEAFAFDVSDEMKQVATNTVAAKLAFGEEAVWGGINQTPKLYATAIRVGYPARPIIAAFKEYELARRAQRNFTLRDRFHGMEKAGAIEFINSMLIQSDHGFVKVFPNWIGADASFENLRAKGAFTVSAEMRGGRVVRIAVKSEKGGIFRLVDPFGGNLTAGDGIVVGHTRFSGERTLEFSMQAGETRTLCPAFSNADLVDCIDPFIGSVAYPESGLRGDESIHGFGKTFPGAATPFGMVQLSPDTVTGGDNGSGYSYAHGTIEGFSFFHMSGVGWYGEFGNFQVMPGTASKSRFSHDEEKAEAGYYRVRLPDAGVVVELTAAKRAGMMRFTYENGGEGSFKIDLARRIGELSRTKPHGRQLFRRTGENSFEGEIVCDHRDGGWGRGEGKVDYTVRFRGVCSKPLDRLEETGGETSRVVRATFPVHKGEQVVLHVAFDFFEMPEQPSGLDFDAMREEARRSWSTALGCIRVSGGTERERRIFATALYHAMLDPREIGSGNGFVRRTVFSGWDVYRSEMPLMTLIRPDVVSDTINSMMETVTSGKRRTLPRWDIFGCDSGCMVGQPLVSVMACAYERGIRSFDAEKALALAQASLESESNDRQLGFTPGDLSKTLEYAYADWCCGRMAQMLGKNDVAARYFGYAQAYTNCWSKEAGWMRARTANGGWLEWHGRKRHGQGCVESNPWQQGWFVPHDPDGLMRLVGGRKRFTEELGRFFSAVPDDFRWNDAYNHPNETCHALPYLWALSCRPEEVGRWTRRICGKAYGDGPFGLCGNDDVGQMSAWYVLSAIGLHPLCPGDGKWYVTAPIFKESRLSLGDRAFTILAPNAAADTWRICGLKLNGRPLSRPWVETGEITAGGVLEISLGK